MIGNYVRGSLLCATVFSLAACSGDTQSESSEIEMQRMMPLPQSADSPNPSTARAQGEFYGVVTETMNASSYTYVRLESNGESIWAAGPQTQVTTGEKLGVSLALPMENFRSDALNRDFGTVYFVNSFRRTASDKASAQGSSSSPETQDPSDFSDIEPIVGGHTVSSLWNEREDLAGKDVVFRGRVVKYNAGILGRNWLHVQDGTGDSATGTHDITVTTDQTSKVGDVVTVRGVVVLDKDFGAGYSYEMIIEGAKLDVTL